jgi:hypothetical protein
VSRVPQEWNGDPWFMGRKEAFKDWATSDVFPRWLRVTWAAYAQIGANGHAEFRQLELAGVLGEEVDGIWIPAKRQRVREAIDGAIERHLLLPGSKALCLVVPRSAIAFGAGDLEAPCRRHPRSKRNARTVSPEDETTRFQPVVSSKRNDKTVSFQAQPSSSSLHPVRQDRNTTDQPHPEEQAS